MKTKSFSYQRLKARRDKIFFNGLQPYTDAKLSGNTITDVCNDVAACLHDSVSRSALFESIRVLAGTTLTQQQAKTLAWRLAGNIDKLIDGQPALPWSQQLEDEVVPVCVEEVKPTHKRKMPGYLFKCRALSGTPCPTAFTEFVSTNSCRAISRVLGFSAPWGPYPYSTPLQFVNLLFFAHVEAARSRSAPSFMRVTASSSMVRENREKIEVRCRAKPCPNAFEHSCVNCWAGYDQCPYAVHPQTYIVQHCVTCNSDGFFNPGESNIACQRCRRLSET